MEELNSSQASESVINSYIQQDPNTMESEILHQALISIMHEDADANHIILYVNRLLTIEEKREDALLALSTLIRCCSATVVNKNADFWVNCIGEKLTNLKLGILENIVKSLDTNDESSVIINIILKKILNKALLFDITLSMAVLDCLKACMYHFPQTSYYFGEQMESYLIEFLSKLVPFSLIWKAGSALNTLMQATNTNPEENAKIELNWTNLFQKFCNMLDKTYNSYSDPEKLLKIESYIFIEEQTKLNNVTVTIRSMLMSHFSGWKYFSLSTLLQVIEKGLRILPKDNYRDEVNAAIYLNHIYLLRLLKSLISCVSKDMITLESTVTKLLIDCLVFSEVSPFKYSDYKAFVYMVLTEWIVKCKNSFSDIYHQKLLSLIINDVAPEKKNITLMVSNPNEPTAETSQDVPSFVVFNESACEEALQCGTALFTFATLSKVDKKYRNDIVQKIIFLVLDLQEGKLPDSYTKRDCQKNMYKLLISFILQSCVCNPPLIVMITNILMAEKEVCTDYEILGICLNGLTLIGRMSQSRNPSACALHYIKENTIIQTNETRWQSIQPLEIFTSQQDPSEESLNSQSSPQNLNIEECMDVEIDLISTDLISQNNNVDKVVVMEVEEDNEELVQAEDAVECEEVEPIMLEPMPIENQELQKCTSTEIPTGSNSKADDEHLPETFSNSDSSIENTVEELFKDFHDLQNEK